MASPNGALFELAGRFVSIPPISGETARTPVTMVRGDFSTDTLVSGESRAAALDRQALSFAADWSRRWSADNIWRVRKRALR